MAFLYLLFGKISFAIEQHHTIVTIVIFASEGFALAAAIIYRTNILPGIFLGQLLLGLGCMPILATLVLATINTIEAYIAIILFDKFKLNKSLQKTQDIFGLIMLILFVLQPFSAILGNLTLLITEVIVPTEYFKSLFFWWFGNTMGQILFTPMLLLIYAHFKKEEFMDFLFIGLFFILLSYLFQVIIPIHNLSLLLSITLPLIIYLSSKKGLHYATFSVLVVTFSTLYLLHLGMGVFTEDTQTNNIINLNFYFLSQILLVLIIGTLFNEKRERAIELELLITQAIEENRKQERILAQQSRLAQMGEAINMIAHQWRQPLNILNGLVMKMDMKLAKQGLNDKYLLEKEFTEIEETTQYMSHTINDFKDFFRPKKEKVEFYLHKTIEDAIRLLKPLLLHSDIEIQHTYDDKVKLLGYPNEIGQVIINIINNAKDALIANNINREKKIYIWLSQTNKSIKLIIEDNAGGINEEIIEYVFDPYFSTKGENEGTGIGLYISKMVIEKHMNGKISVENTSKGAKFTIVFKLL